MKDLIALSSLFASVASLSSNQCANMHLVLVSSLLPVENPTSGFDIANRAVFEGLCALGHRVSVIGYLQPGQTPAAGGQMHVLGEMEVTNARVGAATKLRWLSQALIHRTTLSSAKMLAVSQARIEDLLTSLQPFDGLVLNSVQLPSAFLSVFARHPSVYVAHNAEAHTALENAQAAARLSVERFLFRREARLLRGYERRLTAAAVSIWTFSESDRFAFGDVAAGKAAVLPLVTRWAEPPEVSGSHQPAFDVGLIGSWSWKANRIGLDWFLQQVAPRLPKDLSIAVAGHMPETPHVAHPGIRFLGKVPDARAFVDSCSVIPLVSRGGTGVQLKTIETFEMGMPCVATKSSLRGIDTLPENCFVTDDAAVFARALEDRVAHIRAGDHARLSGTIFHAAQKNRLLSEMDRGLKSLREKSLSDVSSTAWRAPTIRKGIPTTMMVTRGGEAK